MKENLESRICCVFACVCCICNFSPDKTRIAISKVDREGKAKIMEIGEMVQR